MNHSTRPPRVRRSLLAMVVTGALVLAACGDDDGDAADVTTDAGDTTDDTSATGSTTEPSDTGEPVDTTELSSAVGPDDTTGPDGTGDLGDVGDVEPTEIDRRLIDAVDTTLDLASFSIEIDCELDLQGRRFEITADGAIDYDQVVGELEMEITEDGITSHVDQRFDGSNGWVSGSGPQFSVLPTDVEWVEGDVQRWREASSFGTTGLLGAIIVLKGSRGAQETGTEQIDGDDVTTYEAQIVYGEAVEAAGALGDDFQSAFSVRAPVDVMLDVEVALDDHGVVRRLEIVDDSDLLDARYDISVDDPGDPVEAPPAPDASDVLRGPRAEEILDQLIA